MLGSFPPRPSYERLLQSLHSFYDTAIKGFAIKSFYRSRSWEYTLFVVKEVHQEWSDLVFFLACTIAWRRSRAEPWWGMALAYCICSVQRFYAENKHTGVHFVVIMYMLAILDLLLAGARTILLHGLRHGLSLICRLIWLPMCKFLGCDANVAKRVRWEAFSAWCLPQLNISLPNKARSFCSTLNFFELIHVQDLLFMFLLYIFIGFEPVWSTVTPATCSLETESLPCDVTRHQSYQVEMIYLWKTGLPANPSTIELDRSLMSRGSQEATNLCAPHPLLLSSSDHRTHIWYRAASQCHVATAVIGV